MKISKMQVHNVRSILDCTINMADYSVLIGQNNVGKSNILAALRLFYDKIKFNDAEDFPKIQTTDNESWVEITFSLTESEQVLLKEEYKTEDGFLKLRRIFKTDNKDYPIKASNSNIFAYEHGVLSNKNFYGAKNVSLGKIGDLIYIPAVNKIEDITKTSGTSPLKSIIEFVVKNIAKSSPAFTKLQQQYSDFSRVIKDEVTSNGLSLSSLTNDINNEIQSWGILCNIDIASTDIDTIIKNQIQFSMIDKVIDSKVELSNYGQGFQRNLIYTLIKLSTKYIDHTPNISEEFAPNLTVIAFEEPEAFLHISQQETMNYNLEQLSCADNMQVVVTSHSTTFASRNIKDFDKIIRLDKSKGKTTVYQLSHTDVEELTHENLSLLSEIKRHGETGTISAKAYRPYKDKDPDAPELLEQENFRYLSWIDSERAGMFFANVVIICEGATEKVVFDYLLSTEWGDLKEKGIYILDAMGKFNINRYMNLFGKLGIAHSVLFDRDASEVQRIINQFIVESRNSFTRQTYCFNVDFEHFLGIEAPTEKAIKPLNAIRKLITGQVAVEKIRELRKVIESLLREGIVREIHGEIE